MSLKDFLRDFHDGKYRPEDDFPRPMSCRKLARPQNSEYPAELNDWERIELGSDEPEPMEY